MKAMPTITDPTRFWSKVDLRANQNICWEWKTGRNKAGYGTFTYKGLDYTSSRVAYYLFNVADPGDMLVCHHCDNPSCCNPKHLFLGTELDNTTDKINKGRAVYVRGEDSGNAKLTEQDVYRIRYLYANGASLQKIANEYNIGQNTVIRIHTRANWSHLPEIPYTEAEDLTKYKTPIVTIGSRHGAAKLTEAIVLEIRKDYANGMRVGQIKEKYGIDQSDASRIVNRKRWTHI